MTASTRSTEQTTNRARRAAAVLLQRVERRSFVGSAVLTRSAFRLPLLLRRTLRGALVVRPILVSRRLDGHHTFSVGPTPSSDCAEIVGDEYVGEM